MADPRGEGYWGPVPPPLFLDFFLFFFYKNEVYGQKVIYCIKQVLNLSQNAGNGHFRDSHFQKFLGACPQIPLVVPPPPLKVLHPLEISHAQQFFNLGISVDNELMKI